MSQAPADDHVRGIDVPTPEAMRALGHAFGRSVRAGDVLLLHGPFGAGKTTFVQGLAEGLDILEPVTSPSFVLENQYQGRLRLFHVDLFRLERIEPELIEALAEHLDSEAVLAIEWPERLPARFDADATTLIFAMDGEDGRRVTLATPSERFEHVLRQA